MSQSDAEAFRALMRNSWRRYGEGQDLGKFGEGEPSLPEGEVLPGVFVIHRVVPPISGGLGSGGQLLPGAPRSSDDMHECFSKALEEAERRVVEYSKLPEWGPRENERYARRRDPPPQI